MTHLRPNVNWMLKELMDGVPGTRNVVVLSGDGLRLAQYATEDDVADRLAAACAGLQSLSSAIAAEFPKGDHKMRLVVVEAGGGFFYLMAAGPGAYLAVVADEDVDAGLMGHRMRDLVARIGEHLASPPRADVPSQRRDEPDPDGQAAG
jgi:predicted regulator of Ras-like GTPase activity (Roadblock/LC7/MglB family)